VKSIRLSDSEVAGIASEIDFTVLSVGTSRVVFQTYRRVSDDSENPPKLSWSSEKEDDDTALEFLEFNVIVTRVEEDPVLLDL
jgi:hypothetical protein